MEDKKVKEKITDLNNKLGKLEKLLYGLKTPEGKIILTMMENTLLIHQQGLEAISLQELAAPYYEYDKNDLQKMKALRAKIDVLRELVGKFDITKLEAEISLLRNQVINVSEGEPLQPIYS
jgi:hypothetical protein|tara:strand:+ start:9063 stop:9425 length:363 start_codon:yes stop_codon:yes gene_type:complete